MLSFESLTFSVLFFFGLNIFCRVLSAKIRLPLRKKLFFCFFILKEFDFSENHLSLQSEFLRKNAIKEYRS